MVYVDLNDISSIGTGEQAYLNQVRNYMPEKHARLIEAMWKAPSIKDFGNAMFVIFSEIAEPFKSILSLTSGDLVTGLDKKLA